MKQCEKVILSEEEEEVYHDIYSNREVKERPLVETEVSPVTKYWEWREINQLRRVCDYTGHKEAISGKLSF